MTYTAYTQNANRQEPKQNYGAEGLANFFGPVLLREEEQAQYKDRDRNDVGSEQRGGNFQTLDRGQNGDGRRDNPVSVQKCRS